MYAGARPMILVTFSLLDNALKQFSGRSAGWRKYDDLEPERQREARAEDGDAEGFLPSKQRHAREARVKRRMSVVRWARTPKRRGVLIKTSEFDFSQPYFFMMAGRSVSQEPR